ncbi:hypothetical protein ACEU2D_18190 [Brevibacillus laterosporus]|uniref:hypothetical protein n=1 Tax=Brevibacillus laterosporus TaxID=1465 RepID=UPI0035A72A48
MENKYPDYVYENVGKRMEMTKAEIDSLSEDEVFTNMAAWELGHPQWASIIKKWIEDIYNIKLDEHVTK